MRQLCALLGLLLLVACSQPQGVRFHETADPPSLADWGILRVEGKRLILTEGVIPYELATPLFTDHASKLRTVWLPEGGQVGYDPERPFTFPVGTIISKTFYFPLNAQGQALPSDQPAHLDGPAMNLAAVRLIETRLLVHRASGWVALPYVWNETGTEARLKRIGGVERVDLAPHGSQPGGEFAYVIPNMTQCGSCHIPDASTRALSPIGPTARSLDIPSPFLTGAPNQLQHLAATGLLKDLPSQPDHHRNAGWMDAQQPLEARARAYLDVNCGHCHNPAGPARTSGMYLDAATTRLRDLGVCKPPVAAGQGTGDRNFGIVPGRPDDSILIYRMQSQKPNEMMPEIGRSTIHADGVRLVSSWIAEMEGQCSQGSMAAK